MNALKQILKKAEFAQIGWVVPNIERSLGFLEQTLGIAQFPPPVLVRAQDLAMTYRGEIVAAEWLTTQVFHGGTFIELVQPLSGKSMFHDYLATYPQGGTQHMAFRLAQESFNDLCTELKTLGFDLLSEVNHPIAQMAFFDTYQVLGVATEIMGVTPEGWAAIEQMKSST